MNPVRSSVLAASARAALQAAISEGRQPPDLTLERILRWGIPLDWTAQHCQFGLEAARSL